MTPLTVRASKHARRRFKERAKLPPRATERMAALALREGMKPNDPRLSPPLRAKIERTRQNNLDNLSLWSIYRVYRDCLFIFAADGTLITVIHGFDDPDQKGQHQKSSGRRWLRGEIQTFKHGRRPRRTDAFGMDEDDE